MPEWASAMNALKKFTLTMCRFEWWAHISKMLTLHKDLSRLFLLLNTFPFLLFLPLACRVCVCLQPEADTVAGVINRTVTLLRYSPTEPRIPAFRLSQVPSFYYTGTYLWELPKQKALFNALWAINIHSLNLW